MDISDDYDLSYVDVVFICQKIVYAKYSEIIATASRRRNIGNSCRVMRLPQQHVGTHLVPEAKSSYGD